MTTATITLKSNTRQPIPFFFDEDGFLSEPSTWTEELAREISRLDGLGQLTQDHWIIIKYVRTHFFRFGAMPLMRRVCRANNLKTDAVKQLFGSCRVLWRIAGLPNPGEEAKAYMI